MSTHRVKFLTDYKVKNPESPDEYFARKEYRMNEASMAHFVRRGVAEEVGGKVAQEKAPHKNPEPVEEVTEDKPPKPPKPPAK